MKREASAKKAKLKVAAVAEESKKSNVKKVKKAKEEVDKTGDHPLPKNPPSSWAYFNSEFLKKWVAEGGVRTEAMAASSIEWKDMSEEQKAPYEEKARLAKEIVARQKEELKKLGYYMLEDGTKTTDPQNASLLKIKKKKTVKNDHAEVNVTSSEEEEKKGAKKPVKHKTVAEAVGSDDLKSRGRAKVRALTE